MLFALIARSNLFAHICRFRMEDPSSLANFPPIEQKIIALDDYTPEEETELGFKKGDRFLLNSDIAMENVTEMETGRQRTSRAWLLAIEEDLAHLPWISLHLNQLETVNLLMAKDFDAGAFVVHPKRPYSISIQLQVSVKVKECANAFLFNVEHHMIEREGTVFRIHLRPNELFKNLTELLQSCAELFAFSVKKKKDVTPWHYDSALVRIDDILGSGKFGKVYSGTLSGRTIVALKMLNVKDRDDLTREAEIARECNHPNILQTIGICIKKHCIITEFLINGSLKDFLKNVTLSREECQSVAVNVASGMAYLESQHIVHRDLAARNILVGDTIDTIKIADFGLSRSLLDTQYYTTRNNCFSLAWTAPEAFVIGDILIPKPGKFTHAADVWSFGIVLWETYSNGEDPYGDIAADHLYHKLTEEGYRLPCPEKCQHMIYEMMNHCWSLNSKARPKFREIQAYLSKYPGKIPISFHLSRLQSDNGFANEDKDERPTHFTLSSDGIDREESPPHKKLKNENSDSTTSNGNADISSTFQLQSIEKFVPLSISAEAAGKRHLKSVHSTYLQACTKNVKVTMSHKPRNQEHWFIQDLNGKVALKAHSSSDLYLRALSNGSVHLNNQQQDLETWKPIKNKDESWSFLSVYGGWLSARKDRTVITVEERGTCESFWLEFYAGPKIPFEITAEIAGNRSLKSVHCTYLRAWRGSRNDGLTVDMAPHCRGAEHWSIQDLHGKVALKSAHSDLYLRALSNGSVHLNNKQQDLETWKPFKNEDGSWSFLSVHGEWLSAREDRFVLTIEKRGTCECFWLELYDGPVVSVEVSAEIAGNHSLKSVHGTYLRAWNIEWRVDVADQAENSETWTIQDLHGKVALKANYSPDRFLSAFEGGAVALNDRAMESEMWKPFKNQDGSWSLQSFNGQWLGADEIGRVHTVYYRDEFTPGNTHFWLEISSP